MEYWHDLETEVRKMKVRALEKLVGRMTEAGKVEFFKLYNQGIECIRTDGLFELAFDDAERILKREGGKDEGL